MHTHHPPRVGGERGEGKGSGPSPAWYLLLLAVRRPRQGHHQNVGSSPCSCDPGEQTSGAGMWNSSEV